MSSETSSLTAFNKNGGSGNPDLKPPSADKFRPKGMYRQPIKIKERYGGISKEMNG